MFKDSYGQRYLNVVHEMLTKYDHDNMMCITGYEGRGKSHLGLHFLEYWYTLLGREITPELVKYIAMDQKEFLKVFKDLKPYEMMIYDEAGDISSKKAMSKFNNMIVDAAKAVRGLNMHIVFIMPYYFDFEIYFRRHRMRFMIEVYKRGRFKLYDRKRIDEINGINENRMVKKLGVVKQVIYDNYPMYDGVLFKPYQEKKRQKMDQIRQELYNKFYDDKIVKNKIKELEPIAKVKEKLGAQEAAEIFGVSERTIYSKSKEYNEMTANED